MRCIAVFQLPSTIFAGGRGCTAGVPPQATAREAVNGAKDINDWVAGVTQGMIKDLVPSDE